MLDFSAVFPMWPKILWFGKTLFYRAACPDLQGPLIYRALILSPKDRLYEEINVDCTQFTMSLNLPYQILSPKKPGKSRFYCRTNFHNIYNCYCMAIWYGIGKGRQQGWPFTTLLYWLQIEFSQITCANINFKVVLKKFSRKYVGCILEEA